MLLIYIWLLLTSPSDRLVCSMWTSAPPTQASLTAAGCVFTPDEAAGYIWRGVDLWTRQPVCERPASELPAITCDLYPLDHYMIQVIEPGYQEQLCAVSIKHSGPPSAEEISSRCGTIAGGYELRLVSTGPDLPPATPAPFCPLPTLTPDQLPADPSALATANDYQLLATRLRWYYGTDDLAAAWQNQFDGAIYAAGQLTSVPPRLLKGVLAQESQFWPLWNDPDGAEVGLGQLTDNGADMALRFSRDLYAATCPIATRNCEIGYDVQPSEIKQLMRDILRRSLKVYGTPRQAAAAARSTVLTWARILAAYYCSTADVVRAAGRSPSWSYTLAAYHAGTDCVRSGEVCPLGQEYVEKVMR
jgi:hypothetical protein